MSGKEVDVVREKEEFGKVGYRRRECKEGEGGARKI